MADPTAWDKIKWIEDHVNGCFSVCSPVVKGMSGNIMDTVRALYAFADHDTHQTVTNHANASAQELENRLSDALFIAVKKG